jgi:hypothetical protein
VNDTKKSILLDIMEYITAAIANALREGNTDPNLVASWLYYQGETPESVVTALPSALLNDEPRVIQNAQEGINRLRFRFGLEISVDLQSEIDRLKHNTEFHDAEDTSPAKRARMA